MYVCLVEYLLSLGPLFYFVQFCLWLCFLALVLRVFCFNALGPVDITNIGLIPVNWFIVLN